VCESDNKMEILKDARISNPNNGTKNLCFSIFCTIVTQLFPPVTSFPELRFKDWRF